MASRESRDRKPAKTTASPSKPRKTTSAAKPRARKPPPPPAPTPTPPVAPTQQIETRRVLHYSRFVARAKLYLPLAAGAIILLMGAWPSISTGIGKLSLRHKIVDAAMMGDFRMLSPRYTGLDKNQRPFTVTATSAREQGVNTSSGEVLMGLDNPKADIISKEGAWVVVTGKSGIYQPQAHLLDLSNGVTLFHDKGYRFETQTARIDLDSGSAVGRDAIAGGGPSGTASGAGFRVLKKGDIIVLTGKSHIVLTHDDTQ